MEASSRLDETSRAKFFVRVVLEPPIFGLLSWFSVAFYGSHPYLNPTMLLYEAVALVCLFILFVEYVEKALQEEVFFAQARTKRDLLLVALGCYFRYCRKRKCEVATGELLQQYSLLRILIFTSLFFNVLLSVAQIVTSANDTYYEEWWNFHHAHIHLMIGNIVVTTAGLGALMVFDSNLKSNRVQLGRQHNFVHLSWELWSI